MPKTKKTKSAKVGLDIYITGVCLLVPYPGRHVSVLMPDADSMKCPHKHKADHHRSVLVYDRKHSKKKNCDEKCGDNWCVEDLSGFRLTLSNGVSPTSFDLADTYMVNRFAPDRRAKRTFGSELKAEVVLASGRCVGASEGARLRTDGRKVRMPNELYWRIDDIEPKFQLTSLVNDTTKPLALDPASETRIAIYIRNVPQSEVCPITRSHNPPPKGSDAHHFYALDQLLVQHHVPIIEPVWEDDLGDQPCGKTSRGGNPYTCMPGGTDPGDGG